MVRRIDTRIVQLSRSDTGPGPGGAGKEFSSAHTLRHNRWWLGRLERFGSGRLNLIACGRRLTGEARWLRQPVSLQHAR